MRGGEGTRAMAKISNSPGVSKRFFIESERPLCCHRVLHFYSVDFKEIIILDESRHQNVNRERDNFIEEDILVTRRQISSRSRKRNSSPTVIRSSASKMARQRVIEYVS